MADKKITELTATTTLGDADLITTVQGGTNKKLTGADLKSQVEASILYSNATPMPEDVGGYEAGDTFTDRVGNQMFDGLLYPYQYPSFSAFDITGESISVEVGYELTGIQEFAWTTVNPTNVQANSISIYDITGSTTLFTGLADDSSENYDFTPPVTKTTATSNQWQIEGINSKAQAFTKSFTMDWHWARYWGTSANTSLNSAQILALTGKDLATNGNGTFNFAAGDYKYFAWPSSFSQPDYTTDFKDASSGIVVAMQAPYTVSVTNINGQTTNYEVYRTSNTLAGTINITVS